MGGTPPQCGTEHAGIQHILALPLDIEVAILAGTHAAEEGYRLGILPEEPLHRTVFPTRVAQLPLPLFGQAVEGNQHFVTSSFPLTGTAKTEGFLLIPRELLPQGLPRGEELRDQLVLRHHQYVIPFVRHVVLLL